MSVCLSACLSVCLSVRLSDWRYSSITWVTLRNIEDSQPLLLATETENKRRIRTATAIENFPLKIANDNNQTILKRKL